MKVGKVIGNICNTAANVTINVAAAAAGATIGNYVITHDAMNDDDLSIIVGAASGVGTFCITRGAMMSVKNGAVRLAGAAKTRIGNSTKNGSTNP